MTDNFLANQLWKNANPVTVPLWLGGLWFVFRSSRGRPFRILGWMYVVPLLILFALRGLDYYLGAAYPMLIAAGVAYWEQRLDGHTEPVRRYRLRVFDSLWNSMNPLQMRYVTTLQG